MAATITEPLLVTREQLDEAIRVVEGVARDMGIEIRIEARIDIDPEIPSASPVQLLTVWVARQPQDGFQGVDALRLRAKRELRGHKLYAPTIPLETLTLAGW